MGNSVEPRGGEVAGAHTTTRTATAVAQHPSQTLEQCAAWLPHARPSASLPHAGASLGDDDEEDRLVDLSASFAAVGGNGYLAKEHETDARPSSQPLTSRLAATPRQSVAASILSSGSGNLPRNGLSAPRGTSTPRRRSATGGVKGGVGTPKGTPSRPGTLWR